MAGDYMSEIEADDWVESLKRSLGCPHIVDLIFYPEDHGALLLPHGPPRPKFAACTIAAAAGR